MNTTKIKREELKRGDMFCEITARADRPILTAFKDGDDQFFDPITYGTEVHRIDVPDYSHELTQFSWKLKQLDDMVCGMQLVGDELKRLQSENEKLLATIDKVRVAMRKRGSVVAIQAVNQTIYEHDHIDEKVI